MYLVNQFLLLIRVNLVDPWSFLLSYLYPLTFTSFVYPIFPVRISVSRML